MSMTREQILSFMENPALLNDKTLIELKEILDEFPYFQTVRLLYTRNLLNEDNFRFVNQLKICALYATDRRILYQLLNPVKPKEKIQDVLSEKDQEVSKSSQPSDIIKNVSPEKSSEPDLNYEQYESAYRLADTDSESEKSLGQLVKEINESAGKQIKSKETGLKEDLIDRFLKENPAISNEDNVIIKNSDINQEQEEIFNENDEFITETLAKIYIKQGLYQKAINAFQKLTLKYPEKSAYFARQIEEVNKLLNK